MGPFDVLTFDVAGSALDPAAAVAGPAPATWRPGPSWPRRDQLGYVRELVLALLLVLAAPYLLHALVTRPGRVLAR